MKKKVLVCGATGFIGRNLAERLTQREDFEITGTYNLSKPYFLDKLNMVKADLRREEDVNKVVEGKDIIIQMAATTSGAKDIITKPYIHVTDNALMNSLLLRAAFEHNVSHFIFPSCTVMYQPSEIPVKETDFNGEILAKYFGVGWTKVYVEKMSEFYSNLGRTKHTVLRHSNIYGYYDKFDLEKSHVFGATTNKIMNAKDGKIVVWGTGEEKRDLLYVSDILDFIELAIDKQENNYGLYNVGLGEAISVRDLVKKIIKESGKDLKIEYDISKPTIKTSLCLDCSKVERELGWKPKVSLDEGIKKTIGWYNTNKNNL